MGLRREIETISPVKALLLVFVAFVYVVNLFAPHYVDGLLASGVIGDFSKSLYQAVNGSQVVAVITVAVWLLVIALLSIKYYKRRFAATLSVCFLLIAIWILADRYWIFASIWGDGTYRWILGGTMASAGVFLLLTRHISTIGKGRGVAGSAENEAGSEAGSEVGRGGESQTPDAAPFFTAHENEAVAGCDSDFAEEVVATLRGTRNRETSFAIGITGEWGSGKTTLLNELKRQLQQHREYVIEFNPWLAMSDKTVVKSFFDKLANVADEIDQDLRSPLEEYVKAIIDIEGGDGVVSKIAGLLEFGESRSYKDLKQSIAGVLRDNGRKIYVIIDDIDRLEFGEMFEVMRLIRNTADFPYLTYIAAYDRQYAEDMLSTHRISNPDRYLDKIFNVEIEIPAPRLNAVAEKLTADVTAMGVPAEDVQFPLWRILAPRYLSNFREIKRFARSFAFLYKSMVRSVGRDEFSVEDLFLLELIRYTDTKLYQTLKNRAQISLSYILDAGGRYRFVAEEADKPGGSRSTAGGIQLTRLLNPGRMRRQSAGYISNYKRYFTYRLESTDVRHSEVIEWLDTEDEEAAENRISAILGRIGGYNTLLYQISWIEKERLAPRNVARVVSVLLRYYQDCSDKREMVTKILRRTLIEAGVSASTQWDDCRNAVNDMIAEMPLGKDYESVSELIVDLYEADLKKEDYSTVKEKNRLREWLRPLLTENFKRYLQAETPDAVEMADKETTLRKLYLQSMEWYEYLDRDQGMDPEVVKSGYTPLFEEMRSYFAEHKSQRRAEFIRGMFSYPVHDANGEEYEECLSEQEAEVCAIDVFGRYEWYARYLADCFEREVEEEDGEEEEKGDGEEAVVVMRIGMRKRLEKRKLNEIRRFRGRHMR